VKNRVVWGNVLALTGLLLLLGVIGMYAFTQVQADALRNRLRVQKPALAATSPAVQANSGSNAAPGAVAVAGPTVPSARAVATAPKPQTPPGPPVRLVIPDLDIDIAVTEMVWKAVQGPAGLQAEWQIPENTGGHHINSAVLGASDNIVISGHNNVYGKVFERISMAWDDATKTQVDNNTYSNDILNGHTIQLYSADGRRFEYRVSAFYRLHDTGVSAQQRMDNTRFIQPTHDARLTLVTCWPPASNSYRLILQAVPAT
jgi:hypothetical protein